MSLDVLVLGLASVVRPTSVAAVYAFLGARSPHRLLLAFLVAGLALSLAVGVTAVALVHLTPPPPTVASTGRDIAYIVLGLIAIATGLYSGLRSPRDTSAAERPSRPPSAIGRRLQDPKTTSAAVAGVATHLPGAFYLAALAAIVAGEHSLTSGLLQVGLYNLLWFAIPLAALVSWVLRPGTTRDTAARLTSWIQKHKKPLIVGVFVAIGVYLVSKGAYRLLTT